MDEGSISEDGGDSEVFIVVFVEYKFLSHSFLHVGL